MLLDYRLCFLPTVTGGCTETVDGRQIDFQMEHDSNQSTMDKCSS